jgi:hypothetical protein
MGAFGFDLDFEMDADFDFDDGENVEAEAVSTATKKEPRSKRASSGSSDGTVSWSETAPTRQMLTSSPEARKWTSASPIRPIT